MQDNNGKTLGFGSGFFVKPNLIATTYHVIAGASSGTAKLVGKSTTYKIEGFTATDKYNDLALLKVPTSGIKPLSLGNSDTVKIGEMVYVAGNLKGLEGTFSDGIISSRRGGYAKGRLQTTAPISPGSSGGPVLNSKGEAIGIAFMTIEGGQNLNFAIPSLYLKTLLSLSGTVKPFFQGNHVISAETYFARGNISYDSGLYDLAIINYNKVIQLKPDAANAYINRGLAKGDLGQYSAAISDYNKTIQLKPDDATAAAAYNNRGEVKRKLSQYFAAISDYDKAIHLKANDAMAYYNRGLAKYYLGQYSAAISDYDKAIQLDPDDAISYYNRGLAKAGLRRYSAAINDYNKAIQLKSDEANAYINRGAAKVELRRYSAAINDFDKAIQLKPDDAKAHYNRGVTQALLNRSSEAKQGLRTALRLAEKAGDESVKAKIEEWLRLLE